MYPRFSTQCCTEFGLSALHPLKQISGVCNQQRGLGHSGVKKLQIWMGLDVYPAQHMHLKSKRQIKSKYCSTAAG